MALGEAAATVLRSVRARGLLHDPAFGWREVA